MAKIISFHPFIYYINVHDPFELSRYFQELLGFYEEIVLYICMYIHAYIFLLSVTVEC